MIYSQLRDLTIFFAHDQNFSKIHKTGNKKFLDQNQTNKCLMILNDNRNTQRMRLFGLKAAL
jgi:hypothetical protein